MSLQLKSSHRCFGGWQNQYTHQSDTLACEMQFSIFLPSLAETQKVPVLYWLSGLTCTDENFVQKAGAQQFAEQYGVAIVAPDTSPRGDGVADDPDGAYDLGLGAGFYLNATQQPWASHYRMYDYILDELPAIVNRSFNVNATRLGIFGHSMGGHGAMTIALKNPGRFRSVSAFSPICAPTQCPWGEKAFTAYLGAGRKDWENYDAVELVRQNKVSLPLMVDQGLSDHFLQEQLKTPLLEEVCQQYSFPLSLRYLEGYDHSYFFIASFIKDHVAFHASYLNR